MEKLWLRIYKPCVKLFQTVLNHWLKNQQALWMSLVSRWMSHTAKDFFFNWQCLKQVGEIFWLSERCRKYRSDRVSCCTHCRGALSQNIYWHPRKFAESFALTGRRGDIKSLFGSALDYVSCLHCHPHRRAVRANRGEENCCCLTLSFSSASLQKTTKYRNHIIFNDVPATTM